MKPSPSATEHWPPIGTGIWMRWWGYLVRWLVFGVVVHVFQPASNDPKYFWVEKLDQILIGLSFGFAGAVVFTVAENTLNTPRVNWKSWLIVLASWLVVKVVFVSMVGALE